VTRLAARRPSAERSSRARTDEAAAAEPDALGEADVALDAPDDALAPGATSTP
jgi:hypothetical protein